jgi:hypothetical protein
MEDKIMSKPMTWRPATYVKLASVLTFFVATTACTSTRVRPQELSQEVPQSAFNEENWDTFRSDSQYQTYASKKTFKKRVKNPARPQRSSVAGQ